MVRSHDLESLNPDMEGVCPCGKKFFVCTPQCAVIHELPMCEKFKALEPHEYLRYIRLSDGLVTDN